MPLMLGNGVYVKLPSELSDKIPKLAPLTMIAVIVLPSGSLSFLRTPSVGLTERALSSFTVYVSFTATGAIWAIENPIGKTSEPVKKIITMKIAVFFTEWPLRDIEYNHQAGFLSKISA